MQQTKTLLAASALLSLTTLTAEASLTPGIADGKNVVYSSVSNITWTGDANLLGTMIQNQGYDTVVNAIIAASPTISDTPNPYDGSYGNYDGDNRRPYSGVYSLSAGDFSDTTPGRTTWFGAQAFSGYLNSINYAGSSQWALPSASLPSDGSYMNGGQFDQFDLNYTSGLFTNLGDNMAYWSGTEYAPEYAPTSFFIALSYHYALGVYDIFHKDNRNFYAWAVSPGQVAAVPVPGAVWLMGSGLLGLLASKRRGNIG